ncbi:MAG: SDR family NAD(P)-dependent oxidoreductase [Flavobacteriales bacterium]|nr:SDR family NAD(P)-dependent oxidoreductase [Bacteroidota bacterium]MCB9241512.1 SDR family NAD(P)-dependent oxidoreductase [Flavobacteriales bacterium]
MTTGQTVWITGAGSGIGKALCLTYARSGATIILSGRRKEVLDVVATECREVGATCHVIPLDLAKPNSIGFAVKAARLEVDRVDVLINNGGVSQRSLVIDTPIEVDRQIFEVNFFGTVELTKEVLPWMIEKGGGQLVVISSISGIFGFPLRSAYSASKHAVAGFFETLGLENLKHNILTSVVYPGRIRTEISKSAITADGTPNNEMDRGLAKGMDVMKCAHRIHRGIQKKKRKILVGGTEMLLVYIYRWLPALFWRIAPNINPK